MLSQMLKALVEQGVLEENYEQQFRYKPRLRSALGTADITS
jgi:hypothetical protein